MRSNIKSAALLLALSFLAGCIVNIPEQEGTRPGSADMPADLVSKDSDQDLDPDMVVPGEAVRIEALAPLSVSVGVSRDLNDLFFAVDEAGVRVPDVPLSYETLKTGFFSIDEQALTIAGSKVGVGSLKISSPDLESVTVDVQVITTKTLTLPTTIYVDLNEEKPLTALYESISAPEERELLQFMSDDEQIAQVVGGTLKGVSLGETTINASLLHLKAPIRVVVRNPQVKLLISPPVLRLASNSSQGDGSNIEATTFEIVSLDAQGELRETGPDEILCESPMLKMVDDDSWQVRARPMVAPLGSNQYTLSFSDEVAGYGALTVTCGNLTSSALVEVVLDRQVAAGGAHSCAAKTGVDAPSLVCWGSNEYNALGRKHDPSQMNGDQSSRPDNANDGLGAPVWLVDAGRFQTCAVNVAGEVFCAGVKPHGSKWPFGAVVLPANAIATEISVGAAHACAVTQDGALYCWGENRFGQLGQGDTMPRLNPPKDNNPATPLAVQVDAARKWVRVSAGVQHTCALDVFGEAFCWGVNSFGRLGDGTTEQRLLPAAVSSPNAKLRFISIAAADTYTCAVEIGGRVYCWGQNHQGRLAKPAGELSFPTPQLVSGGALDDRFAVDVDASAGSVCALVRKSNEKLRPVCWGENSKGQLGRPAATAQETPAFFETPQTKHVLSLAMGEEHGCLFMQGDASPHCWGAAQNNRLGNDVKGFEPFFALIGLFSNVVTASFGANHGCALYASVDNTSNDNSNVYCWGLNNYNQASLQPRFTLEDLKSVPPVHIPMLADAPKDSKLDKIYTGPSHSCGLDGDNLAFCWGDNRFGQTGAAASQANQPRMSKVGSTQFKELALGQGFTCGIINGAPGDGSISCWGAPELGRLGNPAMSSCSSSACGVTDEQGNPLSAKFTHIAAATATTCALGKNDTELGIYCWGDKVPRSDTMLEQTTGAVKIWSEQGLTAFALKAGDAHFCALVGEAPATAKLLCWGDNAYGEVGVADKLWVNSPVEIRLSDAIDSVALGADHSCALLAGAAKLSCWGRNNVNQLGDPLKPFFRTPADAPYNIKEAENSPALRGSKLLGGATTTCLQVGGAVHCAGSNAYGQLGTSAAISSTPVQVQGF